MTTEQEKINKSNAASQTLFRFASLRNPQLAEAKNNDNFIVRDTRSRGYFDEKLAEWYTLPQPRISKMDFLIQKIKAGSEESLSTNPRSVKNLISLLGMFYDAGKLLAKEGNFDGIFDKLKARTTISNSKENLLLDPSSLNTRTLWDTVIYEVLMQDNFYLKEVAIQTLQAINYFNKYDEINEETIENRKVDRLKSVSLSKVVLPQYVFVDTALEEDDLAPLTVNETEIGDSYIYEYNHPNTANITNEHQNAQPSATQIISLQKKQNVAFAELKKEELETLKKELEKLHRNYRKSFKKSYDTSYKEYIHSIQPEQDAYAQAVLTVEAGFTEETTEAQKRLAINSVAKPSFPEFVFEAGLERNLTLFKEKLSAKSLNTFASNLGTFMDSEDIASKVSSEELNANNVLELEEFSVVFPEDENLTYEELLQSVHEKIKEVTDKIYNNTEVEKQEYVSVGGVLIPVQAKQNYLFAYTMCAIALITVPRTRVGFNLLLNLPDPNWDIANVQFVNNFSNLQDSPFDIVKNGNSLMLKNLDFNDSGRIDVLGNAFEIHLTFINGKKAIFTSQQIYSIDSCVNGTFSITETTDDTGGNNSPDNISESFIPSGFGIKRLGIADYLKVEQSTHAYVEGEVANIENIMAREYREKSTRRLRRSEVTETTSSDTEREQLTDTTTTSRFEMQSEVAKILQESTDIGINANTSFGALGAQFNLFASYANHRSKEESMRQAVTQAKDITARALDRVVTKVHEERIEKIIEEFEENNSHGFDNRKGDKNVVGVYRWVDKLMKNQVWNYGKRMMFEFAVPQPAKLHTLAMTSLKNQHIIEKPVDPRKSSVYNLSDFSKINDDSIKYWSSIYGVDLENFKQQINLSLPISFSAPEIDSTTESELDEIAQGKFDIEIPEGYSTTNKAKVEAAIVCHATKDPGIATYVTVGNKRCEMIYDNINNFRNRFTQYIYELNKYEDKIGVSFSSLGFHTGNINIDVECELNNRGKLVVFNKIIEAYEIASTEYNQKVAEEETKANNIKGSNPLFYRQIEQEVLKHNCIAYLTEDDSKKQLGQKFYTGDSITTFEVKRTDIDKYTSLAKFMEQAFEWEIMSYNLYPYYWANREDWEDMYYSEEIDPVFRSFLRSGLARVVVTVRPGFEDAVQFYMSTGRLWNGGEVPVIADPMYLSIVDELKNIKGEAQGKSWMTRVPTPLTILQAKSIGLEVKHALPFTTEDPSTFENPDDVITESNFNFKENDSMMESEESKQVSNIEINNDYLQLTTNDDPRQVVSELSLDDLKEALE